VPSGNRPTSRNLDPFPPKGFSLAADPDDIVVVIPARDAEGTIDATLASVAGQSFAPGAVVIVDDRSTDRTVARARTWADRLPLLVVAGSGEGPGPARHAGILAVRHPHIALLDSDDVWLPDHLASVASVYRGAGTLATSPMLRWIPGSGVAVEKNIHWVARHAQLSRLLFENYVRGCCLFARADYEKVGGFRRGVVEDWDLWIRMVRAGVEVVITKNPTALYRLSRTSVSQSSSTPSLEVETLRKAVLEALSDQERALARKALRLQAGRLSLLRSYEAARDGRDASARRAALASLRGPLAVKARALAVLASPAAATNQRDRRRWTPRRWLRG
jgi:GT2 family glycosyltransferase